MDPGFLVLQAARQRGTQASRPPCCRCRHPPHRCRHGSVAAAALVERETQTRRSLAKWNAGAAPEGGSRNRERNAGSGAVRCSDPGQSQCEGSVHKARFEVSKCRSLNLIAAFGLGGRRPAGRQGRTPVFFFAVHTRCRGPLRATPSAPDCLYTWHVRLAARQQGRTYGGDAGTRAAAKLATCGLERGVGGAPRCAQVCSKIMGVANHTGLQQGAGPGGFGRARVAVGGWGHAAPRGCPAPRQQRAGRRPRGRPAGARPCGPEATLGVAVQLDGQSAALAVGAVEVVNGRLRLLSALVAHRAVAAAAGGGRAAGAWACQGSRQASRHLAAPASPARRLQIGALRPYALCLAPHSPAGPAWRTCGRRGRTRRRRAQWCRHRWTSGP